MKLNLLLFFLTTTCLMANNTESYSQGQRVDINISNGTIIDVFNTIEEQSEFKIFYKINALDLEKKYDVEVKKTPVSDILENLFSGTEVSYEVIDKIIVIVPNNLFQEIIIKGKITDTNGSPMPGVNIMEKGTTTGAVTDLNGNYSIAVSSPNATLRFSFVGYITEEVDVNGQSLIDIILVEDITTLDEVVVTALGIKREEKALGYAVQKIDGEGLQKVSGVDVGTSLTGKVAGLLVQNSTDFNVEPEITIRGESPLLVIDGVAYANKTLNDISSEDIETITVLKGATASALYGFRGASGAILITTKNGSTSENGLTVDLTTNTMFSAGFLAIPEKQSVYGRGTNNTYDRNSTRSWGTVMDGAMQTQWDPFLKEYREYEYLPVGKDNFKNFLEQGYITNNNVNVAYRQDNVALRSSLNWTENKGQYPNSMLNKYTYTLGGDINLERFQLSSNLSYAKRESPNMGSNGYTSYDPMYSLLIWSASDYNILDYKDNYWIIPEETQNYTYQSSINNPYFDRYEKTNDVSRDIFNADLSMNFNIAELLKVTARSGVDFYVDRGQIRISKGSYVSSGNTGIPGNPYTWNGTRTGAYLAGKTQGFSINNDLLLTGNSKFSDFTVDYIAGGTVFYKRDDNYNANTVGGISVPGFFSLNASVNPASVSESTNAQQVNSLFGRLAISWNNLLFVEATGRNDWSSTLAGPDVPKSKRSYFYPSFSGSFMISELLPESTKNWLDLMKIRNSWTQSKTPASIYAINSVFTIVPGTWNDLNGASAPTSLYDLETILPESANTYEIGFQSIMLKKRIAVDVSYYDKLMYDFLEFASLTSASGYSSNYINTDEEISRKGWEVALNTTPIRKKDLQWDVAFNWSTYKRVYTKLDSTYSPNRPWVEEGSRVDTYVGRDFLRVPETGEYIYSNGRIQRSGYDSVFGYSDPDWLWGVNSTLKFKNFSLFVSLDGVVGGLMNTRTESYMWQTGGHPDSVTPERALDVANPGSENYIGNGMKVISGSVTYDTDGNITSDDRQYAQNDVASTYKQAMIDLHNSSAWGGTGTPTDAYEKTFLKLRELSLSYQVPSKFLNGWGVKGASISFIGQNVFMWAKDFKYSDPDGGREDFADPSVRYLGTNIKLTF